ncbi:MAG TPA: LysE family transporter [Candidatus Saccharimonadales bacterium]|nr:LysE family transporter [Candidatus Saccharimonadales bacterium]
MEYLPAILAVALIHFLAVVSPGPDFIMIVRNSLVYSRRTGVYSALGLSFGILVHIAYCLAGIAVIISQSILLFSVFKYIGAAYLIYIGIKSFKARRQEVDLPEREHAKKDLTALQAVRSGFITNVANPKATLFFLSLFTIVIDPTTPFIVKVIMSAEMVTMQFVWFALVAVAISHRFIKQRVSKAQHYIERFMGGILILFGLKVATAHNK